MTEMEEIKGITEMMIVMIKEARNQKPMTGKF